MKLICKEYPYNPRLEREDDQVTHYGVVFYKGEAVEVPDDVAAKLKHHPAFEVSNEKPATEKAESPKPRKKAVKKAKKAITDK